MEPRASHVFSSHSRLKSLLLLFKLDVAFTSQTKGSQSKKFQFFYYPRL